MLFADLLSLHLVTFLMFFILVKPYCVKAAIQCFIVLQPKAAKGCQINFLIGSTGVQTIQ